MRDVREISEEEKQSVLSDVGMRTISHAVEREGMLIFSPATMHINWSSAKTWAKMMSHEYSVTEDVLTAIIIEHLKARAMKEIQEYV